MTTKRARRLVCLATIVLALASDPLSARTQRDFDGDGKADILISVQYWGEAWGWDNFGYDVCGIHTPTMSVRCSPARGFNASDWVDTTAPFRGGSTHQLLVHSWWEDTTFITDVERTFEVPLLTEFGWYVQHAGDFNGDGIADLVWNDFGDSTALWLLDASSRFAEGALLMANPYWRVTHVTDFDGDGRSDLLWHNGLSGATAIWLMNGIQFAGGAIILERPFWSVALTGDFNGDGKSDLVWRNAVTGETALWIMNGMTFVAGAIVVSNVDWRATHVADLDGDGRSDLIWHNQRTGRVHAWLMDGLTMKAAGSITLQGHTVVTAADYDGDGFDDLVWREESAGVNVIQRMNGLAALGAPIFVSRDPIKLDPADWRQYLVVP
jgi:hypothetical protein